MTTPTRTVDMTTDDDTADMPQLQSWAERRFETAYARRQMSGGRYKTSRRDFRAGYLSALVDSRAKSAFLHPEEVGL